MSDCKHGIEIHSWPCPKCEGEVQISLETKASSAYVQGQLNALVAEHLMCPARGICSLWGDLREVLDAWMQAEAELAEQKAIQGKIDNGLVINTGYMAGAYAAEDVDGKE